jgi:hypothetical protein
MSADGAAFGTDEERRTPWTRAYGKKIDVDQSLAGFPDPVVDCFDRGEYIYT